MPVRPRPRDRRSRVSVCLLFAALGLTQGSWAARIPDVRDQLAGMTDARWGVLTVSMTAGSLLALAVTFLLVRRTGARRLSRIGVAVLLVDAPLLAASSSTPALVAGLVAQGFAGNLLAMAMNAQAVQVERGYARRIMSGFHATYSGGQLAGGVLGTVAAGAGVSPAVQLTGTGLLLTAALLATLGWAPPDAGAAPTAAGGRPLRRRLSPQLLLLAAIGLMVSINEGAASQWSATYTSHALDAGPAAGAATFSCFSVAMLVSRLAGDRVVQRVGQRAFLTWSSLVAAAGVGLAVGVGTPAAAFVGFALLGIGSGCVAPTVYGLAGNQPHLSAGEGVAVAALAQWPAFLLGPPLIGALAGAFGLRAALLLLVLTSLAIAVCSRRVLDSGQPERTAQPPVPEATTQA
ncbi:MFS transporter [Modestobacter sp. VKM Ac-2986]|uniref:MFS transporter n=1 Tax=Modestobacter sp. VKM Ac-2986 TaxID=3004140 RepID=UPI0022AB7DD1|nr:MFS transporter [Modestobacter sp. VKM Ac-2986]MCZ2830601.1 MFS transporter [Modestobacter sp. VKM Ac-2986]